MRKYNLKLIILSLLLAGLTIFILLYFSIQREAEMMEKIHLSNPIEKDFFETAFKFNKKDLDLSNVEVVAGIIPHHLLAADLIAEFFYNLRFKEYEAIILLGPNHFNAGDSDIIISGYDWQTPYGILECDKDFYEKILQLDGVGNEEEVFRNEHSINSEVSFIKRIFPEAKILPIILKRTVSAEYGELLAKEFFELSEYKNILVIASVDFCHYKDSLFCQQADQESIAAINSFGFDEIYDLEIDSPASIYILLEFSRLNVARFELLNNSNSALLANKPELEYSTSYVTGYFTK